MRRIVADQAPRGAETSTTSPTFLPRTAAPSGEVGETVPAPPTALTSTVIVSPPSSRTSTTEPMPTVSPLASSTMSAWSRRERSVRIRASSRPCSFFAAWYSKFSERSPNSRAFLIAATASVRFGPSSSSSSVRRASACFSVRRSPAWLLMREFLPLGAASAPRRVDESRPGHRHPGLLECLRLALQPRDPAHVRLLLGEDERDGNAGPSRAARAAGAVRVAVGLLGRVEVHDVRDVVDVEAARRDVRRHERPHLPCVEARQRTLALRLPLIAVDGCGVDVVPAELLDEAVGPGLR